MLDFNLGIVNKLGIRLGLIARPVAWLSRPDTAMISWNEYLFALVLAGEQVRTVTVALQIFIGENGIDWGLLMAGGTVVGLPAIMLFLWLQRRLVGGLTAGGVKG